MHGFFARHLPVFSKAVFLMGFTGLIGNALSMNAYSMDLDWHGQFRAETHWLFGYSNSGLLAGTTQDSGYSIPLNGSSPASFQNLFLRLDPRAIVNDNVTVYSDIWLGTPDRGMFGSDLTGSGSFSSTRTGRSTITANEFYAEISTDFGTMRLGRAPLNWGLGVVWNNTHSMFDRMPSTGDVIGLVTKLGSFKLMPSIVKYRLGTNLGGTFLGTGANAAPNEATQDGWSGASDYTLGLSYENTDEQIEGGLLFMRRLSGPNQSGQIINPLSIDPAGGGNTPGTASYGYNTWDFFLKKKSGIFTVAAEVPLISGQVDGVNYSTLAFAAKVDAQVTDKWVLNLNLGQAEGQENLATGVAKSNKVSAFYFHPDYRPGLIMFNYNRRNFQSLSGSPFNDPITNARFFALGGTYSSGKWSHGFEGIYATALQVADVTSGAYFNTQDGYYKTISGVGASQEKSLGFEVDYTLGYQWDEAMRFSLQSGILIPGKFYDFSNTATKNSQKTVFASSMNVSIQF